MLKVLWKPTREINDIDVVGFLRMTKKNTVLLKSQHWTSTEYYKQNY